jgi:hypothetical protein
MTALPASAGAAAGATLPKSLTMQALANTSQLGTGLSASNLSPGLLGTTKDVLSAANDARGLLSKEDEQQPAQPLPPPQPLPPMLDDRFALYSGRRRPIMVPSRSTSRLRRY